jgi:Ca2+-binding EF-hand superfamily protein
MGPLADSLRQDEERQGYKYAFQDPGAVSARYHHKIPDALQNEKYSRDSVRAPQPDEPPVRFNEATLARWFMAIDRDGSGSVSQKELILALRGSHELRHLFCHLQATQAASAPSTPASPTSPSGARMNASGALKSDLYSMVSKPNDAKDQALSSRLSQNEQAPESELKKQNMKDRKDQLKKLRNIMRDLDEDGSGGMDFYEFVEFFRRSGLLLEYKTSAANIEVMIDAVMPMSKSSTDFGADDQSLEMRKAMMSMMSRDGQALAGECKKMRRASTAARKGALFMSMGAVSANQHDDEVDGIQAI